MYQASKKSCNPIKSNKINDENILNIQYWRDFYIKDYKYIGPETIGRNPSVLGVGKKQAVGGKKINCRYIFRKWLIKVMEGLRQFLYEGSLHGVKYVFEPSFSRKERCTWVVIMVVSIFICSGIIIRLFSKSTSSPFVNVIDSLPTPVWAIPFPAVVICPHLHVKLSYANVSELDELHKFFASRICPQMFREDKVMKDRLNPKYNKMLMDFIVKGSPECKDVVKRCYWRGTDMHAKSLTTECCKDFFRPLFTNYGLCFTFNGLPLNGMTNVTIPWQKTFNPYAKPQYFHWNLDSGYPKVFPAETLTLPHRVMASGENNGLGVELFLNTSEHQFACDGNSLGFNVLISSPTDHVYTSTVLRLPMDRMTTIEVSPITYKTDNDLRYLSPDRRQCFFQNERKLVYYEFYTDSNCKHDLLVNEAVRLCNCVLYHWPRKQIWEPICSTATDFRCIDEVRAKVEEQLIYAYFADSEEQRETKSGSTSCHPSCNDILYSSQVFYSDLIRDAGYTEAGWDTAEPERGEVTRFNVHFYDDMFLGQHRHMQYDDYYFIGAIGGLLSLFLGFSIISVVELVYFVFMRPLHAVVKDHFCT